jgi:hypothetical protein
MASVALAALFSLVVVTNLLWPGPAPEDGKQSRMPPTQSPFPVFSMAPVLHVVSPLDGMNESTRLLMTSLQGFVNREQVELYLDVDGVADHLTETMASWQERYGLSYDYVAPQQALDLYASRANGMIVYDPSRPESINIGTIIAGQMGGLLVGPDLAGWMSVRYGLPVLFDYAERGWAALDAIGAYDRALQELYPSSSPTLLAILPPDRWTIRDYLVATQTFVFYLPQGVLASPFDTAATMRILRAAPRGIPVLGWFNSPTLTEENSFLQLVSREGKFVVGVQNVTNLSVLTALGRTLPHGRPPAPAPGPLEDKTYVVLAIPDGDNLDFVAGRMRELWAEPVRGTLPFAWSLNPLLVELAPPLLDAYYDTATPLDRFIAAPSGAGYLYPDYAGRDDLSPYVAFSKRYLDAAAMDVVWLLNAFPASEIRYSSATLSTYVEGLQPHGVVLDYADQPRSRDAWMQTGGPAVAPVVRSTHFWTTADNVLGKVGAAAATWDRGPHFIWLTIYTFRFHLRDARALVDVLDARLPGGIEVVTPDTFFSHLRHDFVREGAERLRVVERDLIASIVFRGSVDLARRHLLEATTYLGGGDEDRAAAAAFRGLEELRGLRSAEALLLSLLVLLSAGLLAMRALRSPRGSSRPATAIHLGTIVFIAAAVGLFMFALREAVDQNFWTYPTILIGVALAGVHRSIRTFLDRAHADRAPSIAALLALVFVTLAIRTSAAFPLALLGTLLALDTYLVRRAATSEEILTGLSFGVAIGFVGAFDYLTLTGLALLLVAPAVRLRAMPIPEKPRSAPRPVLPGFFLALPLSAIAVAFSYSLALRLEIQGERLPMIAAGLLVIGSALGVLVWRVAPQHSESKWTVAGLLVAAVSGAAVLFSSGTVLTALALLGLIGSLAFSALAALAGYSSRGGDGRHALKAALCFVPLFLLFFRSPPIMFSLILLVLPEPIEYAFYAPTILIAATSLGLAVVIGVRGRLRTGVGKHYVSRKDGGAGGP